MNLKNSCIYSWLKTIRYKKNIYYLLILLLCSLILMGILTYRKYLFTDIENIESQIDFRTLIVLPNEELFYEYGLDYDYGFEKIAEVEHVLEVYYSQYNIYPTISDTYKSEAYTGDIDLRYGSEYTLPEVTVGETFTKSDRNVAICPEKFYPSSEDNGKVIEARDLIGTTFNTQNEIYEKDVQEYDIYEMEFTIIGLYDAVSNKYTANTCFISGSDMIELYNNTLSNMNSDILSAHLVVVDDVKNIDEVVIALEKIGFTAELYGFIDDDMINKINIICIVMMITVVLCIIIITAFYVRKKIINSSYDIGILKAIGYKNKKIRMLMLLENIWISLIALLIAIIVYFLIIWIFDLVFYSYFVLNFNILKPYGNAILITIGLIFFLPNIVDYIILSQYLKKKTTVLIKGES